MQGQFRVVILIYGSGKYLLITDLIWRPAARFTFFCHSGTAKRPKRQLSPLGAGMKEKRGLATGREGAVVVRALPLNAHPGFSSDDLGLAKFDFDRFSDTCSFRGLKTQKMVASRNIVL